MFKARVLRRGFSLWRGVPRSQIVKSASRDGHETIHIQRVRVKKPYFTRSRLLATTLTTAAVYGALRWLDAVLDEEEEEDHAHHAPRIRRDPKDGAVPGGAGVDEEEEAEDEDEEDDDVLLFLPTGLSRAKERTYYRGTDEEWQEFIKVAKDTERMKKIRLEIVTLLRSFAANNVVYKHRLGPIKDGIHFLQIQWPDGPPLEYEQPGIEVTEDLEFRKGHRPIHERNHQRLQNTLMPTTVAYAMYLQTKVQVYKNWRNFRSYIGWQDEKTNKKEALTNILTPPPLPQKPDSASASKEPSAPTKDNATPAAAASSNTQQQPAAAATSTTTSPSPQKEQAISALAGTKFEKFLPALPSTQDLTLDLSSFRLIVARAHKHYKVEPPRGTFIVWGLVQIVGERAKLTLDVTAYYDPKQNKYVYLQAKIRSLVNHRVHPKGGN